MKHLLLLFCLCLSSTWAIAQNAPVAVGDINHTFLSNPTTGFVLTNDFDPDGNILIINPNPVILPQNGNIVINVDGSYVYTPTSNFTGTDQFQYEVCDDGTPSMCDTAWCTIQVFEKLNGQNNAPIANYDYVHVPTNYIATGNVLANDFDLDGDNLVIYTTPVIPPNNGTATLNLDGTFTYVSTVGFVGIDSIVYEVCDDNLNSLCSQGTLVIIHTDTLTTNNQKPCAADDAIVTSENTSVNGNVFLNDTDVNTSNNLTTQLQIQPVNGTLIFNSDGSYTYTPANGFTGTELFTYQVCDNGNPVLCDYATVYITILASPIYNVTSTNPTDCALNDGMITISGLSTGYEYSIDSGSTWQASNIFTGLADGDYDIVVRDNATLVEYFYNQNSVVLSSQNAPTITSIASNDPTNCNTANGSISITGVGGTGILEYTIDGGINWQASSVFTGLVGGTYNACIRNNDGTCIVIYSGPTTLITPTSPIITNVVSTNPTNCAVSDGTITITATTQVPVEYSIDGGLNWQVSNIFTGLDDANNPYEPRVRNSDGTCLVSAPNVVLVSPISPIILNIMSTNPTSCSINDGSISITAVGQSIEYSLDGGMIWQASNSFTGLGSGSYNVCVRNNNGTCLVCDVNNPITIMASNTSGIPNVQAQDYTRCLSGTGDYIIDPNLILVGGAAIPTTATIQYSSTFGTFNNPTNPNATFTPFNNVAGSVIILATINTGSGCPGSDAFTLTIVDTPVINILDTTICIGSSVILSAAASGAVNYTWSVISGDLNSLNNTTTNTVIANPSVTTVYEVQVQNLNGCIGMDLITVTIDNNCINNAPIATDDINVGLANIPINGNVLVNDFDPNGDNLVVTVVPIVAPNHGVVVMNIDGTYSYISNSFYNGTDTFYYEICDDGTPVMCDTATVFINVISPNNNAPIANKDSIIGLQDLTLYGQVMNNDFDIDGDSLFTNTNPVINPTHGTVQIDSTGHFTYIPDSAYYGLDSFYYQIYDNGSPIAYDTGKVIINLFQIIDDTCMDGCAPVTATDFFATSMNTPIIDNILANDSTSPNGDSIILTLTPHTPPSNGTIVVNPDGTFVYTPNLGFIGTDQFVYEACSYAISIYHCSYETVYITVLPPPNQAPIAIDDHFDPAVNTLPWNVLLNDTDPDGNNLFTDTMIVSSQPFYGTVSLDSTGLVTYNQISWFPNLDTFEYLLCDDGIPSLCDTGMVFIANGFPDVNIADTLFTNPTCNTANGTINITAAGGSGSYQYSIDNGTTWQSSNLFTNLDAGTYNLIVNDIFDNSDTIIKHLTMLASPVIIAANYDSDSLIINATGQNTLEYTIDSGLTWQSSNLYYPVSLDNIDIGVRYMNGLCEVISSIIISNNLPITVVDNIEFEQSGYQSTNILLNDYDLENNALFTKPQVNYYGSDSLTLDSTGLMTIPTNGLTLGSYMITYETCELYNPTNCTQESVFFGIVAPRDTLIDTIVLGTTSTLCVPFADLPGTFDTLTNLYTYAMNNAIVIDSIGNNCLYLYGNMIGDDTVNVLICDDFGFCDTTTLLIYVENGVWPGDTDDDAKVDNLDLLNIGLGYGQIGTMRNTVTNVWNGYHSPEWNVATPLTNVDYRHADANGDGMVNSDDTLAITLNWHKFYVKNTSSGTLGAIPIYIDTTGFFSNLPNVSLPIMLGTPSNPVTNLYGVAFSYEYDTTIYKTHTASINIDTSWIGIKNLDLLSLSVHTPNMGRIDAAMTRIDGGNVNGIGAIAHLNLTIRDDILQRPGGGGFNTDSILFSFALSNVKPPFQTTKTDIPVDILTTGSTFYTSTENVGLGQYITIFPNPTRDKITIQADGLQIESYEIMDMTGRLIFNKKITPQNVHQVNLDGIPSGIYNLRLQTNEGVANKRIVIVQ